MAGSIALHDDVGGADRSPESVAPPSRSIGTAPNVTPLRALAALLLLLLGASILAFAMRGNNAARGDYISYWAAGRQLAHHGDPYDPAAILQIERSAGYQGDRPFFMRNPPSAFFLALPLGFVGARAGAVLWSLAMLAALMLSTRMIWIMHGRPADRLHLLGYLFPPTMACLLSGQLGMFLLLGVVLFLRFHDSRPYLAGAALLMCALKPHLFLPFGVALIVWIAARKAYRILAGAAVALIASVAFSYALDPSGWSRYGQMVRVADIQDEFIPTLSLMFRLAVHRNAQWLQFVPAFAGCAWALWYAWTRRRRWDWMEHGSLLLIVSALVAPYAWFTDQVILIPALLHPVYLTRSRSVVAVLALACAVVEIEMFSRGSLMHSSLYLWTAPAWLAWYLYAARTVRSTAQHGLPHTGAALVATERA